MHRTSPLSPKTTMTVAALLFVIAYAVPTIPAQARRGDDCNLAIVTHTRSGKAQPCDPQSGQAFGGKFEATFQENQDGLTSTLALAPGYSEKQALQWFQQSAQRGDAASQVNLAVMYMNGWGVTANYGTALHWLHAASDRGSNNQSSARAHYNLGILYLQGKGVRQDYAEAFRWFQKAADAGDTSAQVNLGYLYDQGLGLQRDATKAAKWYRQAADSGNALAENDLADMYLRGQGVQQNNDEAFRLFQNAAKAGHTGARIKLGYMYAEGKATPKNPAAAYAWITAVSLAGDHRGDYLIPQIEQFLTPQQIAQARQRAQELSPTNPQQLTATALTP